MDWDRTELVSSDGHGWLRMAKIQGSWYWYDLAVKLYGLSRVG